jgi:hypothetical protein
MVIPIVLFSPFFDSPDILAPKTGCIDSELDDDQPYPHLSRSLALFGFLNSDDHAFDLWSSELIISYLAS